MKRLTLGEAFAYDERQSKRQIIFNNHWNRTTIINLVESHPYLEFGKHEDLKAVCVCPYVEDGEEDFAPDYEELTFIVPKEWLKEVCKELFNVDNLDRFLTEEYTSDQSEVIFERALNENKVVMVDFR